MQLIASDILADGCGLSITLLCIGLGAGLFLWLFGWWSHRFWVVLTTTVLAGVFGLYEAAIFRTHPLVAALLLAVAAGLLALALIRVLAFAAGGMAGVITLQNLVPTWDQPLVSFVLCGILGLLLFRVCMMALTSFSGSLLMVYCGLSLLNYGGGFNPVDWANEKSVLLNWICLTLAFLGLTIQFLMDRGRKSDGEKGAAIDDPWASSSPPFWGLGKKSYKKAG
jgi:hypothetical protein